jgi:hypothetical protein
MPDHSLGGEGMDLELRFEPEYEPDAIECMHLSALSKMVGFPIEQRLMKSVVDQFMVDAFNANTGDPIDCQEKVRRAQVARGIFQSFVDKVNTYVTAYTLAESGAHKGEQVLEDPTEGVLDIGDYASELDGVENLFETSGPEESLF